VVETRQWFLYLYEHSQEGSKRGVLVINQHSQLLKPFVSYPIHVPVHIDSSIL